MNRLGYLAVAAAAVLWALGGTYARVLIDRGASPVELTEARAFIAVAGIGLVLAARRRPSPSRPGRRILPMMVGFGLALAAANFTYYFAISLLPVAVAIVIQYTAPGLVVLVKAVEEGKPPSGRVLLALALAFAGVVALSEVYRVIGGSAAGVDFLGVGAALASSVAFASYVLLGEKVQALFGAERSTFCGFAVASVFWLGVQAVRGRPDTLLEPDFIPGILFLGTAGTIAPFLLFLWGLRIVTASPAGIVSTLEPVAAAVLAYLMLGQTLTLAQIVGATSVIVGITVVQLERPPPAEVLVERTAVE
jgi:drug/metabolite transporter (DMT)-like permease